MDAALPACVTDGSLAGYTLLLPSLGLGNVGQLALDLLLNTLAPTGAARHVATLPSAFVEPVVGAHPFDAPLGPRAMTTAVELYAVDGAKLAILQQRAPAVEGLHELWALQVARLAAAARVGRVVCVGGVDAALRGDAELARGGAPSAVYVATRPDPAAVAARLPSWCGADGSRALPLPQGEGEEDEAAEGAGESAPPEWEPLAPGAAAATSGLLSQALGAGYAPVYFRRLLGDAATRGDAAPGFTAVMAFVSEGDNTPEAAGLAATVLAYVGAPLAGVLGGAPLAPPRYWARLHGGGFDQALFG